MNDMTEPLFVTSDGLKTAAQICDSLEYNRYRHHILNLRVSHETMARFYGDVVADAYRERLRREQSPPLQREADYLRSVSSLTGELRAHKEREQ